MREVTGSSPVSSTIKKPWNHNDSGVFFLPKKRFDPLFDPLQVYNALNIVLHSGSAVLLHLIGNMAVNIQGECCGMVAQIALHSFYIIPGPQRGDGIGMPLRYNYDKPEKPRRIKGFEVFSLVFSSFSKPKNHTEISRIIGGVSLTTNE